jgi:hypothetical protein
MATIKDTEPWLYQDILLHLILLTMFFGALVAFMVGWEVLDTLTRFRYRNRVL